MRRGVASSHSQFPFERLRGLSCPREPALLGSFRRRQVRSAFGIQRRRRTFVARRWKEGIFCVQEVFKVLPEVVAIAAFMLCLAVNGIGTT